MVEDKKVDKKIIIKVAKKIKGKVKLGTLLMLMLTFSANSFAWFIYATKVDSGVTAHVRAWNVLFEVGEDEIEEYMNFNVSEIYPGMATYSDRVKVKNNGESSAKLDYEIVSISIFDDVYEVTSTGILTSDDLVNMLNNDYPFKISLRFSNSTIEPGMEEYFSLVVSWPYESGDDAVDTYWGNKAYDYQKLHPDDPSIKLNLKVSAVQN